MVRKSDAFQTSFRKNPRVILLTVLWKRWMQTERTEKLFPA
ncbi:hypothetical protein CLS_35430 [[Clostridium] cf. saccharolyticum K10]|nr:hypothetical protein CLS_35430 [[Clostridium] cf. saccharolyticum K10]